MHLIFRLLYIIVSAFIRPRIHLLDDASELTLRVLPNDLDVSLHMTNGRYLTIMDLGRLDLALRSGLIGIMKRDKTIPILGGSMIHYRSELKPFQRYILETRVVWWDKKWAYMDQRFLCASGVKKGQVAATATVKGGFYSRKHRAFISTDQIMEEAGLEVRQAPECPAHVQQWIDAETLMKQQSY